jgi:hypothetical protein
VPPLNNWPKRGLGLWLPFLLSAVRATEDVAALLDAAADDAHAAMPRGRAAAARVASDHLANGAIPAGPEQARQPQAEAAQQAARAVLNVAEEGARRLQQGTGAVLLRDLSPHSPDEPGV